MVKGTTSTGFAFEVTDEALDNYELLEVLAQIDAGKGGAIVDMTTLLLGDEQKERLKEHVRQREGRVTTTGMVKEVYEIFNYNSETKNS